MFVLFVDDDTEEYELFCEALGKTHPNIKCLYARDGEKALLLLNELVVLPAYIFLDINMPVMGGREMLTKIKASVRFKDIPVIIYSTTSNEHEIITFKKSGAIHFLVKPSSFFALMSALQELIK